jgi:hypothetical protein
MVTDPLARHSANTTPRTERVVLFRTLVLHADVLGYSEAGR